MIPNLPTNYQMAYKRLQSTWKKLHTYPDIMQQYDGNIKEQLELDIIEEAQHNTGK